MNLKETKMAIAFANQIDPRIQVNDANAEVWHASLHAHDPVKVRWAITQHYATSNANGEGTHAVTPARIRRSIQAKAETVENTARALEPPKGRAPNPLSFRQRNPSEWDRLFRQSAEERREELASRGIPVEPPSHLKEGES